MWIDVLEEKLSLVVGSYIEKPYYINLKFETFRSCAE